MSKLSLGKSLFLIIHHVRLKKIKPCDDCAAQSPLWQLGTGDGTVLSSPCTWLLQVGANLFLGGSQVRFVFGSFQLLRNPFSAGGCSARMSSRVGQEAVTLGGLKECRCLSQNKVEATAGAVRR